MKDVCTIFVRMKTILYSLVLVLAAIFAKPAGSVAQSRGPEFKIPVPLKQAHKDILSDSLSMDERPYLLLIGQSEDALAADDYESAALRLVEAMSIEPENPLNVALLSNLGMIYFYNGQDSLALTTLDKVIERSPRLIAGHENKARVLTAVGRDDEAFDEYATIIGLDSLNTGARFYHGTIALYAGDIKTAREDFDVLMQVVPHTRVNYLAQGTFYSMTGNPSEGAYYFRKLIDIDPSPEYYASLVGCYLATDNLSDAADTLAKAFDRYPNDPELYYYRAWLKRDRYELDDAHKDAQKAIELGANPDKVKKLFR